MTCLDHMAVMSGDFEGERAGVQTGPPMVTHRQAWWKYQLGEPLSSCHRRQPLLSLDKASMDPRSVHCPGSIPRAGTEFCPLSLPRALKEVLESLLSCWLVASPRETQHM